jgi:hypothetical protein
MWLIVLIIKQLVINYCKKKFKKTY